MEISKRKVIRTSTVPGSLRALLKGQLAFLNQYFDVIAVSGNGKSLEHVKETEGVRTFALEMQRQISPVNDFISLLKLYLLFKREKPHIVHSITPKAGLLSMLAAKLAGVPIRMHTFTGLIFPSKKGSLQKLLIKMDQLLCWAATDVFPEGEGVKKDLINFGITTKPLKVLANGNINGIDFNYYDPAAYSDLQKQELRQSLNINQNDFVFVFVGRLVRDKGINELVVAFNSLLPMVDKDESKRLKLVLVGYYEQHLDPLLPETVKEIEDNQQIIFTGAQSDVRPYYAISDCLVFPSYREGFPNVVLEAGAMSLPSIVTDISGNNEIIETGYNGIIVPKYDTELLMENMLYLFKNNEARIEMAINSRKNIIEKYDRQLVWNAVLNEYKAALAGKNISN
ncbi:glycosyltransferase family 4 protein [Emticicia sp. TH156]|uniref:glycosyltransferase family 4 protein n=1 Tax=Emticicia sp. TH156 TaxID=2067454 RepID=UPI000C784551|nr:glycosyltransferase family 4 protein [Emticicia sp. TH156]PLK42244.1 glycosyltransferase family 1 protein [Emticicia sp. TH156]